MEYESVPLTTEALSELREILAETNPETDFGDFELRGIAHRLFSVIGIVYRQVPQSAERGYRCRLDKNWTEHSD